MNMYKQISLCLPLLFCSQFSLADWIDDSVQAAEAHTIKLRQHIHQHPELGNMEFKTSELVQKELKSYGIEVRKGYAKRSEEHTSELQSRENLVCRLLL